jgi:hypothetical protein
VAAGGPRRATREPDPPRSQVPTMKRALLPFCLAVLAILATAIPALAGKPERIPFGAPPPQDFAAGNMCADFPVRIETLINKEYGLVFPEAADGRSARS